MSKVESVNFCSISDLAFELAFEKRKKIIKHNLSDEHLNSARKAMEDETMETVYDSEEEYYFLRPKTKGASPLVPHPKDNTKNIIKTKHITKTKTEDGSKAMLRHSIYSGIKHECKECHVEFRNEIALTTHSYSLNRKYLENTEYFDINSSQNMKEFCITDKAGNYLKDIDEAINISLEEIKKCCQFHKVKSFKCRVTAECEYKKEPRRS